MSHLVQNATWQIGGRGPRLHAVGQPCHARWIFTQCVPSGVGSVRAFVLEVASACNELMMRVTLPRAVERRQVVRRT